MKPSPRSPKVKAASAKTNATGQPASQAATMPCCGPVSVCCCGPDCCQ